MRLAFQLLIAGHLFELGFGPHEEEKPEEEQVTLPSIPFGFQAPEPEEVDDEDDDEDE